MFRRDLLKSALATLTVPAARTVAPASTGPRPADIAVMVEDFVSDRIRFARMDTHGVNEGVDEAARDSACGSMYANRRRVVRAILSAVGRGDEDCISSEDEPAAVDLGDIIVAIGENPEDEGLNTPELSPSIVVIRKDRIVRL